MTLPIEEETLLIMCSGFHSISAIFLMACAANFGVVTLKKTSAFVDFSLTMLESMVGCVVSGLALVIGLPAHGPREFLGIVPLGGAGGDEQLRHLFRIHVFLDCRVRRRAQRIEDEQNLVALHQLARLLDRLRRAVAVVVADEIDLAAVDAAFGVDLLEVGILGLADHAVGGGWSAVGHDVADLDFGVGGAGVIFLLGERAAAGGSEQCDSGRKGPQSQLDERHFDLPGSRLSVSSVDWKRFPALARIEHLLWVPIKKKPPAMRSQGALFSRIGFGLSMLRLTVFHREENARCLGPLEQSLSG